MPLPLTALEHGYYSHTQGMCCGEVRWGRTPGGCLANRPYMQASGWPVLALPLHVGAGLQA